MIYTKELYHHGILGQRWGKKNGPPYPLDAKDHSASEKKAGWQKSLADDSIYALNESVTIKVNSDGSSTIPKGFKFNRVAGEELRFNKSGGLYVSHGKLSAAMYMNQLGPTPIAKLLKNNSDYLQNIVATKEIRVPSEVKTCEIILKAVDEDRDYFKKISESFFYTYAYDSDKGITEEAFNYCLSNPKSKEAKRMAYAFCATFGNTAVSDNVAKIYSKFKQEGYDALPDIYDLYTGASESPLIIINPSAIKLVKTNIITKDAMKQGRKYVKAYIKEHPDAVKVSDVIG